MVTVLTESGSTAVDGARAVGDALWLDQAACAAATGWTLKPEGLCHGETCMPTPRTETQNYVDGEDVNIAAWWRLMGRPVLHDAAGDTWMLGAAAADRAAVLKSLKAPDFTLPDLDGKAHSLSDYRGKRVLLTTWSSW